MALQNDFNHRKYELLPVEQTFGFGPCTMFRVRALRDFADVRTGELGGCIQSEDNLTHAGDAWVFDNALVLDRAQVFGDARVFGNARVFGDAQVFGTAQVSGKTWV